MKTNQGEHEIRRHADGSIDYGYYGRRAHEIRDADLARVLRNLESVRAGLWARYAGRPDPNATTASQAERHSGSWGSGAWLRLSIVINSARGRLSARRRPCANG